MSTGNGIIGALLVSLGLDTAAFDTGTKETEGKVSKFGAVLSGLGQTAVAGIAGALAVATGAMVKFGFDSLSAADDIGDSAARLGISAEAYQKLGIAATAAGGTPALMTEAMDKLNASMGAFVQTGGGNAAEAFKQLGIDGDILSGKLATADEAFYAAVKALEGIQDPAAKARISMQLFGKAAGVDMLEVTAKGADGLKAYGDAAESAGRIMSREMVDKLSDAKLTLDNTTTALGEMATVMAGQAVVAIVDMAKELAPLWEQAKQLWSQVAEYLMPSFQALGVALVNFAKGPAGRFIIEVFREIGTVLGVVVVGSIDVTVKAFTFLFNALDAIGRGIEWIVGKIGQAVEWLRDKTGGLINLVGAVPGAFKAMPAGVAKPVKDTVDTVETHFKRLPQVLTEPVKKATGSAKDHFKSLYATAETYVAGMERLFGRITDIKLDKAEALPDRDIGQAAGTSAIEAVNESKADMRRAFSETFSDGIMSALNGDLGGFFTNWWQRVLTRNLDDLGSRLFDLFGQIGILKPTGSNGIFDFVASLFGSSPKNAQGGTYALKGGGPTDSRLFSSWVSPSEIIKIGKAEDMTGGGVAVHVEASPYFDARVRDVSTPIAQDYAAQGGYAGAHGGAAMADSNAFTRDRYRLA